MLWHVTLNSNVTAFRNPNASQDFAQQDPYRYPSQLAGQEATRERENIQWHEPGDILLHYSLHRPACESLS